MTLYAAATLYALGCLGLIGFQVALIFGAPWGRYTQGGRVHGALDGTGRGIAAASILVLAFMAMAMLEAGGVWSIGWPDWSGWIALGLSALTAAANIATPSAVERKLWAPVALILLGLAFRVMFGR